MAQKVISKLDDKDVTREVKAHAEALNLIEKAVVAPSLGKKIVGGQLTTVTAADTVVTGLATVTSVVVSFEDDPADANMFVSAQVGNQAGAPAAGSIVIKTWKSADGIDPTPVAATVFGKKVNWIAYGT